MKGNALGVGIAAKGFMEWSVGLFFYFSESPTQGVSEKQKGRWTTRKKLENATILFQCSSSTFYQDIIQAILRIQTVCTMITWENL